MKPRLTYANVAATLALVFAMGGTAVAAKHYLITSTGQIKPSVLNQLRGQGSQGPAGPQGPGGPQGPAGPAGPVNLGSILRSADGPTEYASPGGIAISIAQCPAGYNVISGGYGSVGVPNEVFVNTWNTASSWVAAISNSGGGVAHVLAQAFCAPAGQAVAASNRHPGLSPRILKLIAAEKATLAGR